jgi:hypothetical protein
MEGSDEFLAGTQSMPDLQVSTVTYSLQGRQTVPSFNINSDFNMDGIGDSGNDALDDFGEISAENSGGGEETLSGGSISAAEFYETGCGEVESDKNDGHRPDVESNEESEFSNQERENARLLDKNEKLLALLSQKKKDAFDEILAEMEKVRENQSKPENKSKT